MWWKVFKLWRLREQEMLIRSAAIGINSSVDIVKDKHIVMLDYDTQDREEVVRSIEELQAFWNLSDVFLFRTKHGFHALGFYDHVPYDRLRMLIDFARGVDPMFKQISRLYRHKTLRVQGKYPVQDVVFEGIVGGREPTEEEWLLGELKRKEHAALLRLALPGVRRERQSRLVEGSDKG